MADASTLDIGCIFAGKGREHDFRVYRESGVRFEDKLWVLADKGYQGLKKQHENSLTPVKANGKNKLSSTEKAYNAIISKSRISIEHIHCYIKRFRILSSRYRNRRKRFGLRLSLICGIYNFQHG